MDDQLRSQLSLLVFLTLNALRLVLLLPLLDEPLLLLMIVMAGYYYTLIYDSLLSRIATLAPVSVIPAWATGLCLCLLLDTQPLGSAYSTSFHASVWLHEVLIYYPKGYSSYASFNVGWKGRRKLIEGVSTRHAGNAVLKPTWRWGGDDKNFLIQEHVRDCFADTLYDVPEHDRRMAVSCVDVGQSLVCYTVGPILTGTQF